MVLLVPQTRCARRVCLVPVAYRFGLPRQLLAEVRAAATPGGSLPPSAVRALERELLALRRHFEEAQEQAEAALEQQAEEVRQGWRPGGCKCRFTGGSIPSQPQLLTHACSLCVSE